MTTVTKRANRPMLFGAGKQILAQYERRLRIKEDLTDVTICNYLSDLRHFAAWCEALWKNGRDEDLAFTPERVTTPTMTNYRTYLEKGLYFKPNSVNRSLISLKRYFAWLLSTGQAHYDPAKVVKLVGEEVSAPRHLNDQKEQTLIAAVTGAGNLRDRAIIVLLLHTRLRARELCRLTRSQVSLGKRSGTLSVHGKHDKHREISLNIAARAALLVYDSSLQKPSNDTTSLFLSKKRHTQLTEQGLGYLIKKYVTRAQVNDVSLHNLCHRFGYRMAQFVPLHRLAQLMRHDFLDTTMLYVRGAKSDMQQAVETITWL